LDAVGRDVTSLLARSHRRLPSIKVKTSSAAARRRARSCATASAGSTARCASTRSRQELDLLGDLALLGALPRARIVAYKAGHRMHVALARKLAEEAG